MESDGFLEINGKEYYIDNTGVMRTGWISITYDYDDYSYTEWYYADKNGALIKDSWLLDKGKWYYFGSHGYMYVGQVMIDGKLYIFDKSGAMETGWFTYYDDFYENTFLYYADASGALKTDTWFRENGRWYYFDHFGRMAVGAQDIGGNTYLFNRDGSLSSGGWVKDPYYNEWYYGDSNGIALKYKWILDGNKWYFVNSWGEMVTGLFNVNGVAYFFNDDGSLVSKEGWHLVSYDYDYSEWYFVKSDGTLAKGWKHYGGKWYYLNPNNGIMATGYTKIKGKY